MDIVRVSAACFAVATAVAGCGGNNNGSLVSSSTTSPSSTVVSSPSPGQPTEYDTLLIQPGDIGADFSTPQPPMRNPNNAPGVAQLFTNADSSRRIWDTILMVADPAAAAAGVGNTKGSYAGKVSGAWQPVDVGSNGAMISGTSPDGAQAVTVLLFSEGRALVDLEFDSAPDDPIAVATATDIGRKQDAAIKRGLPG